MGLFDDDPFHRIGKLPKYVFAEINTMRAKARRAGFDVVDLGMGNPDGATPQVVVDKLTEAAQDKRNHRYSLSRGIPKLREEICKRYLANYGVSLDPETEAIATMGSKDALAHLTFATIGPGEGVVMPDPSYPIHQWGVVMADGEQIPIAMPSPEDFLERVEGLYAKPGRKPAMILTSFPHNPTTQCVDLEFFQPLVELAHRHGTMLVHDFAYADIVFDGYRAPSMLQVPGAKDVGVEIFSMSKSYSMPGWRVGFCLGNPRMIHALGRIKSYLDYGMFQPIQIAAIIALRQCEEFTRETAAVYKSRRDTLIDGLRLGDWVIEPPRATMFVWGKIPKRYAWAGSLDFCKVMLEKALVAVSPGVGFGPHGDEYVRFALVENEQRIRQATRGIRRLLRG